MTSFDTLLSGLINYSIHQTPVRDSIVASSIPFKYKKIKENMVL